MPLPEAMQRVQRFDATTLDEVTDPNANHQRKRLDVIFLSCKPAKKQNFNYQIRHGATGKKRQAETAYHRFFLFQIINSTEVIGMFTKTEEVSIVVLQYWKDIRPGVAVSILNPTFDGYFQTGNNQLLSTKNPLVPCAVVNYIDTFPPTVLQSKCNDYFAFSFVTKDILLENVFLRQDLCPGIVCDGQVGNLKDSCCCISTESRNIPVLEATIKNDVLRGLDHQFSHVQFRSRHITRLFLANPTGIDLRSDRYDEMLFEDTVLLIMEYVKRNEGVRITGWVKPSDQSSDTEKASVELQKLHVVSIEPINSPTAQMIEDRYAYESAAVNTRPAVLRDGHATNIATE